MTEHIRRRINSLDGIKKISVLIPDGETWDAVKVLRCLNRVPGIEGQVLSKYKLPLARLSRYCSSYHCHSSENDDDWISIIRDIVKKQQIDVVLPVTERGVEFISRNRAKISQFVAIPPIADFDLLMMAQDKWSFHNFASSNGFPVPETVLVGKSGEASIDSLNHESITFPALLKPTLLDGGFGIVKVNEPNDLPHTWNNESVFNGYKYILQSYKPGVVFCLGLYSHEGKMISYTLWKTLLTSSRRLYFSARVMEYVSNKRIIELAKQLISAMKWDGIANIDFIVDSSDGSVRVIDFNPRFGQSLLGSFVAGVNFPLLACLGAMGLEYPEMEQQESIKYAHPAAHSKMLISRVIGKRLPVKIRWKHGGLQFAVRDPLPELFDAFQKVVKRYKRSRNIK